jgi:HSP20 family protein
MLVRYDPWSLVNRLHGDIDRLMKPSWREDDGTTSAATEWAPAVDIKEEDERFVIEADVPGVSPEEIEITMEDGVLSLAGNRRAGSRTEREGYRRVERVTGRFYRRFTLPDTADAEAIEAKFNQGVLVVSIPKLAKVQPRKINVQVS